MRHFSRLLRRAAATHECWLTRAGRMRGEARAATEHRTLCACVQCLSEHSVCMPDVLEAVRVHVRVCVRESMHYTVNGRACMHVRARLLQTRV